MEEPTAATARKPVRGPSLRGLVWWTIWFSLAAGILIYLPHEVSYWMLALAEKSSVDGKTDEALAWVEQAKEWTPKSALPRKVTALVLQKAGKLDELGRIDLILQDDDLKPAEKAALHREKSEFLRRKRRLEEALAEFDKAANFKGDLRPSRERLELLLLAKQEDQARREVKQLLEACSTDNERAQVHLWKSEFHQKHAQWEEALHEFDAAAELQPKLRPSIARLELLMLAKLDDQTQQELDKLLLATNSSDAEKAKFHLGLSAIHRRRGSWDEALREFDEAAKLEPKFRTGVERLELLLLADKRDDARNELKQLEQQRAKSWTLDRASIDNEVAYFSGLLGENLDEALQRAERALKSQPGEPAILDTRGYILHRLGRNDEALADVQSAVEKLEESGVAQMQDPRARKAFAVIVYHRSLVLEALGKSAEAERDRARVRELGFEPDERLF